MGVVGEKRGGGLFDREDDPSEDFGLHQRGDGVAAEGGEEARNCVAWFEGQDV